MTALDSQAAREDLVGISRSIDRLVSVEVRAPAPSGRLLLDLYDAACAAQGGGPLTLRAALALQQAVGPGDAVLIVTGRSDPETGPSGQTDGPPGAAALASALSLGLGAVPVLLTEQENVENVAAVCRAAGMALRAPEVARRVPDTCAVLPLAADDRALMQAEEYMAYFQPRAVIAVEKLAPNRSGVAHRASGRAAPPTRARAEVLFELARARAILTVGVGDSGNEIGFGMIEDVVRHLDPRGQICICPCGAGLASAVPTEVLVAANTSNWGAYGIEAALAALLHRPDLMHSTDAERRMLETCAGLGGSDAGASSGQPRVDGVPVQVSEAVVSVLDCIVRLGLPAAGQRPAYTY